MKKKKKKLQKRRALRLSSSFWEVACIARDGGRLRPGEGVLDLVREARGRGGAPIQRATIDAWARAGLVVIATRKPRAGEHHLARPLADVSFTHEGVKRAKERHERELAREQAAA